jgi:hypothetical protein
MSNINDKICVPGIIETAGDALHVVAKYRVGTILYFANFVASSVARLKVNAVQITISSDGKYKVAYSCSDPSRPSTTATWYDQQAHLYLSMEAAAQAVWKLSDPVL